MALSGSFNTTKYSSSSHGTLGLNISWTATQNTTNNTSTIKWTVKSNGTMSSGYYVKCFKLIVKINGTKVINTTSEFNLKGGGAYKKTGSITVTHGADGSKSVAMSAQANIYWTSDDRAQEGSKTFTLDKILRYAQITSFSNFTNNLTRDGYPTLVYSNPAGTSLTTGLKCRLCWNNSGTTNYSSWVTLNDEGGEYTFTSSTLTAANITSMLNACPTSNTLAVTCELASTLNSVEDSVTKVVNMAVVDSNPLAGTASYLDINSSITSKTGSSSIIVQSQSTLRIQMTTPTAQNGASLDGCYLIINNTLYEMNAGSGIYYYDFVQPSLSGTFPTSIDVTDTRGNVTTVSFDVLVQAWEAPTALFTLSRVNGFYTNTVLYVDGSISSVSGTNTMTIKEHHRQSGASSWSADVTVQNKTNTTISLDNSYVWEVQVLVSDEYITTTYDAVVGKGIPIMFIDKNMNSVGVNAYPTENDQLYVDGTIKSTGKITAENTVFPRYAHLLVSESGTSGITIKTNSWVNIGASATEEIEAGKYVFIVQVAVGYSASSGRFHCGIKLDGTAYECINTISQPSSAGCVSFYGEVEIETSGNHTFQIVGRVDNTSKTVTSASYTTNTILLMPTK